jgi:5-methyltetrahydropteroyltriglutamate--homocysteine methyltransferase
MAEPAIKTTVVGSYPIPTWLAAYPSTPNLRDSLLVVLKTQEMAGLDVIADGELSRFNVNHPETNGMIEYFLNPLDGIASPLSREEREQWAQQSGMKFRKQPAGVVREEIDEGALDLHGDFEFVRRFTDKPLKFTVTSPYMLAKTLLNRHYGEFEPMLMALAEVLRRQVSSIDAAVLQVDEANLPGAPEDSDMAARSINKVLEGAQGGKGVHLCFGNYGGQSIQQGQYRRLLDFLNALECDHVVLEFARRQFNEIDVMKELKPSIQLGVGVIDIKDNGVETPDEVARRIGKAVDAVGADRIGWVHPDCGFWMLPRSVADAKMRSLVEGRDLFLRG